MNLCAKNHDEICYEEKDCPCCELLKATEVLEHEVDNKNSEIGELSASLVKAQEKVEWYRETITADVIKKCPELLEPFLLKD